MNNFFSKFFVFFIFLQAQIFSDVTYSSNTTLSTDVRLALSNLANFTATLTLDGAGFYFILPPTSDQVLIISNSVTATLTNILLQNFSPSHISLGSGSSIIFGSGSYLSLLKNETLNSTLRLAGSCVFDGCSKMISLGSSGVIEAQSGSNITLRDVTIYDVNGTNVRCADNTATITFDNVKIINRNTWNFANGAFAVTNNLAMTGGGRFVYQSAYASTINDNSTLFLTDGMTFSYDPAKGSGQDVAGQQNLVFTNSSSKMICDGVTLKITNTGMRLTKGTLQFDRKCSIFSDANLTDTSRALILGDTNYDNDPQINLGPDARVNLESGVMQYDLAEVCLKYGDAVLLKQFNYGLYIDPFNGANTGGLPNELRFTYLSSTSYNPDSYFYAQPANDNTRWGNNLLGKKILTGDLLKLECLADYGLVGNNFAGHPLVPGPLNPGGISLSYLCTNELANAQVSTPNPPYRWLALHAYAYFRIVTGQIQYNSAYCRIFIQGGSVGASIKISDKIYLQFLVGSGGVSYLGSHNNVISGTKKEGFFYHTTSTSAPPNFSTDYIWTLESIISSAYLSSPNYPANPNVVCGTFDLLSAIPPASNYQF